MSSPFRVVVFFLLMLLAAICVTRIEVQDPRDKPLVVVLSFATLFLGVLCSTPLGTSNEKSPVWYSGLVFNPLCGSIDGCRERIRHECEISRGLGYVNGMNAMTREMIRQLPLPRARVD